MLVVIGDCCFVCDEIVIVDFDLICCENVCVIGYEYIIFDFDCVGLVLW